MDHSSSMPTYFNFMYPVTVLFKEWKIVNEENLIGSCFGVIAIAIIYELIKKCRSRLESRYHQRVEPESCLSEDDSSGSEDSFEFNRTSRFWYNHGIQSALHAIQGFIGYMLMLIVMTFNVWLGIATVCGAGLGYFIGIAVEADNTVINSEEMPFNSTDKRKPTDTAVTSFSSVSLSS